MNLGEITRSSLYCDYRDEPCQIKGYKAPILLETTFLILNEIPSPNHDIYISGYNQVFNQDEIINENDYWVDYVHGLIYFHESKMGQKITIDEYFGLGNMLIDATRVVTKCDDKGNVIQVLEDLLEAYPNLIVKLEEAIEMCERMELNIEKLEELWTRISRTQNPSFTINTSQWILDSSYTGGTRYYYDLTHGCNSYNIIVVGYNQDTNLSMGCIPFKTTGENAIRVYTTAKYNAKVIVNASYYHGFESLDTTVVQEIEDSRMGEGSLAVKISKMTNDINTLKEDITDDKGDLELFKLKTKNDIDSINTSINTINNDINTTNELITTTKNELQALINSTALETKKALYPIGSIYFNATNSTNPATLLGFGTWVRMALGRTLVGVNPDDADFSTAGNAGGNKAHTHASGSLVANIGAVDDNVNMLGYSMANPVLTQYNMGISASGISGIVDKKVNHATTVGGKTDSANGLPPYLVVYIWKRTA